MRQLLILVPAGKGDTAFQVAQEHEAVNLMRFTAQGEDGPLDAMIAHVPNRKVGALINDLEKLAWLRVSFLPYESLLIHPPAKKVPQKITEIAARSPLEIFLAGLQSTGRWPSFLAYALAGAVVVWIGFFTNSVYLLLASMLLAPFAGPAMNIAIATASGNLGLFRRNLGRYFAAIAVTMLVNCALTLIFQQTTLNQLIIDVSHVSSVAVLLPLVAGAAGALNLVQSERASLVSGAAVGVLVAASLAPPAGLLGIVVALGYWDMSLNSLFLLFLQLLGINLAGALVFRLYGVSYQLPRFGKRKSKVFFISLFASGILLAALLVWQYSNPLRLQRSSQAERAAQSVQGIIQESGLGKPVEVVARFQRPNYGEEEDILIIDVYMQSAPDTILTEAQVARELKGQIERQLMADFENVIPLVNLVVLEPPVELMATTEATRVPPTPTPEGF